MNVLPLPHDPGDSTPGESAGLLTCRQVVSCYLQQNSSRYHAGAQAERERILNLFLDRHGHQAVAHCRAADLVFFLSDHPDWKSDWTRLRVVRSIQRPFNWAAKLGLIEKNPFAGVTHCQGERGRAMKHQEFQALLRNTDALFRRVLIALWFSAMRPGELRMLEWSFIDLDRGVITLRTHKTAHSRKDRAPRVIVLHPVIIKLLIWIRQHQREGEAFCFLNSRGRPWTKDAIVLRLRSLRDRLGLPKDCKLYGCRHALATRAAMAGVDLATLAAMLGHTSQTMASYYVHLAGNVNHLRGAVIRAMKKDISHE